MGEPLILGVNGVYHESAAALVRGGEVVAAAEEERFTRVKHGKKAAIDGSVVQPWQAVDFCLAQAGVAPGALDVVAYSFDPAVRWRRNRALPGGDALAPGDYGAPEGERRLRDLTKLLPRLFEARLGVSLKGRFRFVSHHLSHLASAFFPSPHGEAAVLCVDGIGEWATTTLAHGRGTGLDVLEEHAYPDSLGFLWEKVTDYLGFKRNGDECKVMGLAAYGDPGRHRAAFARLLRVDEDGRFRVDDGLTRFRREGDFEALEALLGPRRLPHEPLRWQDPDRSDADVAAALQEATERALLALARRAHRLTGARALCLAGGVALNCVANAVVAREGPFEDVFVQPAANDAGTALGAALYVAAIEGGRRPERPFDAYLGPAFDRARCRAALERTRLPYREWVDDRELAREVARRLAEGRIVAWFHGRMEFGPRALGHRSLLADPRNPEAREILNHRVKHREPFRPFCPSVLAEAADEWFDLGPRGPHSAADYMLAACPVRPGRRGRIPAVVHEDGTARLQLVHRDRSPVYHGLLDAFAELTGVPVLLNTSFNDQEPIVCRPEDAIACFLGTRIDDLVLEGLWAERPDAR